MGMLCARYTRTGAQSVLYQRTGAQSIKRAEGPEGPQPKARARQRRDRKSTKGGYHCSACTWLQTTSTLPLERR